MSAPQPPGQQPVPAPGGPPGGPAYGAVPQTQGTNGKATAALVLGIVSFFCLPLIASIAAIILGNMARKEIDAGKGTGRGMATAGLILGVISLVLSVIWLILVLITGSISISSS